MHPHSRSQSSVVRSAQDPTRVRRWLWLDDEDECVDAPSLLAACGVNKGVGGASGDEIGAAVIRSSVEGASLEVKKWEEDREEEEGEWLRRAADIMLAVGWVGAARELRFAWLWYCEPGICRMMLDDIRIGFSVQAGSGCWWWDEGGWRICPRRIYRVGRYISVRTQGSRSRKTQLSMERDAGLVFLVLDLEPNQIKDRSRVLFPCSF